ncbi:hypothetical protein [Shewanella subflava]|uniref:Uncharacterized protein n=1 Tax=Shewanella subflava TaxID=2986476 RepID=A0ABT3ICH1_9GAMM|nr:hypothetical protein [Shewanella subflava]MCW3173752.1 hypothetical protein [Shewanella subflava]
MMPLATIQPVNQSPMNNSWFTGVNDFLTMGLDSWMKIEQINAAKDSGKFGQQELSNTVQNPQTGVNQNIAAQMQQQMGKGLQIGVGTLAAVVGGVAVLYWLTRK